MVSLLAEGNLGERVQQKALHTVSRRLLLNLSVRLWLAQASVVALRNASH